MISFQSRFTASNCCMFLKRVAGLVSYCASVESFEKAGTQRFTEWRRLVCVSCTEVKGFNLLLKQQWKHQHLMLKNKNLHYQLQTENKCKTENFNSLENNIKWLWAHHILSCTNTICKVISNIHQVNLLSKEENNSLKAYKKTGNPQVNTST